VSGTIPGVGTTASTTQSLTSTRLSRRGWLLAAACVLVLAPVPRLHAQQAEVTQLRVERTDEGMLLSASTRFELPPAVDDALAKGIPMFFVAEATLLQDRWYWYDKRLATTARHMRLSYQPLTRRWRLQVSNAPVGNSGLALGQTFDTREEALAAVQRITNWRIAGPGDFDPEARHSVDFRFRLDLSQLPRPFQIGAVGQSEWSIVAARTVRFGTDAR
jgi:hypothetical protein